MTYCSLTLDVTVKGAASPPMWVADSPPIKLTTSLRSLNADVAGADGPFPKSVSYAACTSINVEGNDVHRTSYLWWQMAGRISCWSRRNATVTRKDTVTSAVRMKG